MALIKYKGVDYMQNSKKEHGLIIFLKVEPSQKLIILSTSLSKSVHFVIIHIVLKLVINPLKNWYLKNKFYGK